MPRHLKILALVFGCGLGTSGCFDPSPTQSGGTDGTGATDFGSETTEASEHSSTTEVDPSGTTGTGSTGPVDQAPEIVRFTVNGSKSPGEVTVSGVVVLDVDAADDVGIDRVEYYDRDELVGIATDSPYRWDLLVTSADSGPHTFTALAVDTAAQEAQSEPVSLNVNVVGGRVLEVREDIGAIRWSSAYRPSIATSPLGVHITAALNLEDKLLHATLGHWTFSDDLSLLGQFELPLVGTQTAHMTSTTTDALADTTSFLAGGMTIDNETWRESLFLVAPNMEEISVIDLGPAAGTTTSMLVVDGDDNLIYTRDRTLLAKSPNFGAPPTWAIDIGSTESAIAYTLAAGPGGDLLVGYAEPNCVAGAEHCLRKFSANGSTIWTRGLSDYPQAMDVSNNGDIAVVTHNRSEATIFDTNGDITVTFSLSDTERRVEQVEFDSAGGLVAIGYDSDGGGPDGNTPWARRLDIDGATIWENTYDSLGADGVFTGLVTTASGRLYVVGFSDNFDTTILDVAGRGFVVELVL